MWDKILKKLMENENFRLTYRVFSDNFWEYRFRYLLAGFFMLLTALATGASAYIIKDIINSIFIDNDFQKILLVGGATFIIYIVKGLATYGQIVTLSRIGNSLVANLKKQIFSHLISLPMSYFDRATIGQIFTRANSGVAATNNIIRTVVTSAGRDMLTLVILILVMLIQEPVIALSTIIIGPIIAILIGKIASEIKKNAKEQLAAAATHTSIMKETVTGMQMIKTFTLEAEMQSRVSSIIEEIRTRSDKAVGISARTSPIMEIIGGTAISLIIVYAGWRGSNDPEYVGRMISFLAAFLLAYEPAKRLAKLRVTLEPQFVGVNHMYGLLDNEKPELETFTNVKKVEGASVRFDNVSFSYKKDLPALRGITLEAKDNQKIALVGASGSGKSTIFKLLLGLYPPASGAIFVGSAQSSELTLHDLRKAIAYVSQDAHLLTGSVHENIRFGNLQASEEDIIEAAKAANAHEFICNLSDGYQTFVGEGGTQLSGGQRQRVAIARAFLKNAPIILLDEATSALDTESEREIQNAIDCLLKGRTTLSIAHRLSTIKNSDVIYVLKEGQIAESGSHDELFKLDGVYRHLHDLQFGNSKKKNIV